MRALVLEEVGKLIVKDVAEPEVGEGSVLVKVGACGICGSDIPRAYKDGAHKMPLIIGHEFAGVAQSGDWAGKRVGVFPLTPCMKCDCCRAKKYEMCKSYGYLGSRADGGMADLVAVPEWNLIELPETVSMEQAAMLEPMAVAVHAIRQINPQLSDKVVVMGLGTIGLFVTMFLIDMGIKDVYVIGNKDYQVKLAQELGAKVYDGGQADVFFECVGKQESLLRGIEIAAPSGKICTVGNPHGDMSLERDVYWKILRNQLTLVGTWNSSFTHDITDDWNYVISRLKRGTIHPEKVITHKYGLSEIISGFELMRDKKEEYVKVMMVQ